MIKPKVFVNYHVLVSHDELDIDTEHICKIFDNKYYYIIPRCDKMDIYEKCDSTNDLKSCSKHNSYGNYKVISKYQYHCFYIDYLPLFHD